MHCNNSMYYMLIALIPVFTMYKVPFIGISMASIIFMITGSYVILGYSYRINSYKLTLILLWGLYYLWVITKSEMASQITSVFMILHLFEIMRRKDSHDILRRTVESVSVLAFFVVSIQYFFHLITGFHIPMIFMPFCTDSVKATYSDLIISGFSPISMMYRPSAFFLEPSHYTQYCIFGLLSCMCREKTRVNFRNAVIITAGIIITTSGMGIALSFSLWIWKYIFDQKTPITKRLKQTIIASFGMGVVFAVLMLIPNFSRAIIRIFDTKSSIGSITGRTLAWKVVFEGKELTDLVWGYGDAALTQKYYLTGLMKVLYSYGVIGFCLLIVAIIAVFLRAGKYGRMCCLLYIAFLPFTDQIGFIGTIFMLGMAVSTINDKKEVFLNSEQYSRTLLYERI